MKQTKPKQPKQPKFPLEEQGEVEVESIESRYKRLRAKYVDLKIKFEYQQNVFKRIKSLVNSSIFDGSGAVGAPKTEIQKENDSN